MYLSLGDSPWSWSNLHLQKSRRGEESERSNMVAKQLHIHYMGQTPQP